MRYLVAAIVLAASLAGTAQAQTQLDHDVQRTWDNAFHPGPPGDPRTNWERRRDRAHARDAAARRREADHVRWCSGHPGAPDCGRY